MNLLPDFYLNGASSNEPQVPELPSWYSLGMTDYYERGLYGYAEDHCAVDRHMRKNSVPHREHMAGWQRAIIDVWLSKVAAMITNIDSTNPRQAKALMADVLQLIEEDSKSELRNDNSADSEDDDNDSPIGNVI